MKKSLLWLLRNNENFSITKQQDATEALRVQLKGRTHHYYSSAVVALKSHSKEERQIDRERKGERLEKEKKL